MMHCVARHAAHVATVMPSAPPAKMSVIAGVTLKTSLVSSGSSRRGFQFRGIIYVVGCDVVLPVFNVLCAVAVTSLARRRP